MARPRLGSDMTTTIVARELGMSGGRLVRWVESGVLPPPSRYDRNGVRYFSQDWLVKARETLKQRRG